MQAPQGVLLYVLRRSYTLFLRLSLAPSLIVVRVLDVLGTVSRFGSGDNNRVHRIYYVFYVTSYALAAAASAALSSAVPAAILAAVPATVPAARGISAVRT